MSKILVAAASAAGYVLGTKAGRERYDALRQKADALLQRPEVQPWKQKAEQAIGTGQAQRGQSPEYGQSGPSTGAEPAFVTRTAPPYPSPVAPLTDPSPRPSGAR